MKIYPMLMLLFLLSVAASAQPTYQKSNRAYVYDADGPTYAQYPGGDSALIADVNKSLIYPKTSHPLKGIVRISIEISSSGQLFDVTVMRGLRKDYDYAAFAAVKKLKKFKPGTMNGKAVENAYGIPVTFK